MEINFNDFPPKEVVQLESGKISLCRCWQSGKFPYCDGSHRGWNQEHQQNLGPVVVEVVKS